jgi:penicillin-binding protein 1C
MKLKFKKRYFVILIVLIAFTFCLPNKLFNDPYSTVINDKHGNLLNAKIAGDGQWRFPMSDSLPHRFEQCLITFEDKRFRNHIGIDFLAIAEATKIYLKSHKVKRGGSTLTMQLIRLSRKGKDRNFINKIIEISMALRFEITNSKTEIINLYASHAPFGRNVVGLEAASWRYFGKKSSQLSWSESAVLAVLPNAPSLIHLGKNRALLVKKRNRLLLSLKNENIISEDEYKLALLESIPPAPLDLPSVTPHLMASISKINSTLQRVNSTIDPAMQAMAVQVLNMHYESNKQEEISNGAVLILDTQSGEVLAYIGNNAQSNEKYVDMVMAKRSSGSILKPILYAAQQDAGQLTPHQLMHDIPINLNGFTPQNFDRKYRGAVKADEALAQSLNIPFVLALKEYGTQKFIHDLQKLKITSINKQDSHYGLSLILGGAEVSLWEMCGAYAYMGRCLANFKKYEGKYNDHDLHGPRIAVHNSREKKLSFEPTVLSAGAIFTTFEALSKLQRPDEDGNWQFFNSSTKVAWKTGTSFGHKDAWAIGVSPKYTIGVWIGNASGEGRAGLTGATKAAPVLFNLFNRLPYCPWFDEPWDALQKTAICKHSGHLASPYCPDLDTSYIASTSPTHSLCPYHKNIYTNSEKTQRVSSDCCQCEGVITPWFELPATIAYYYKNHHPEYQNLPPYSAACNELNTQTTKPIDILYPTPHAKVFLPKNMNEQKEHLIVKATTAYQNTKLFWHIDNQYLGTTSGEHSLQMNSEIGEHKLSITDEMGNRVVRRFWVVN